MAPNQDHLGLDSDSDSDSDSGSSFSPALHDGVAPPNVACQSQGATESSYSTNPAQLLPSSIGKADVEALFLCLVCEKLLQDAITLPCGKSICKACIPATHDRVNATYPDHPDRRQGFHCPFNQCAKVHSIGDCGTDVILNKLLDDIIQPLMKSLSEIDFDAHPEKQIFLDSLEAARPELDCQVCYGLYNDPITTGCGHTFCRACLYRSVDHSRHCPICRRDLTISPILSVKLCPSNERLVNLIDQLWPQELMAKRQTTKLEEAALHREFNMSLFLCTLSFPHMPTFLHVFEPRYKLMIRRALDGDRTFGMVFPNRWSRSSAHIPFYELGTLLRITNVEFYPDGRCLLETVGLSRFRVLRHSIRDEYDVGKTERIDDVSVETEEAIEISEVTEEGRVAAERLNAYRQAVADNGSTTSTDATKGPIMNLAELEGMPTRDIMAFALDFVERMRNQGAIWTTHQSISIYGDCPMMFL